MSVAVLRANSQPSWPQAKRAFWPETRHREPPGRAFARPVPSPRHAPEALMNLPPKEGVGNAGCPLHPRPLVHFVLVERTRVTTSTPESPGIPARNGFNGFLRALPGDRPFCHRRLRIKSCLNPVGPTRLRKLDASVGASGPHDFAVRELPLSSARLVTAHRLFKKPPCD